MAGLGYKSFTSGSVLTAAQVQGYLQDQSVMKFATAAARDAALPTPAQGMTCFLADSSSLYSYNGAAWAVVPVSSYYILNSSPTITASTTFTNAYAATGASASLAANMIYEVEGALFFKWTNGATATQALLKMNCTATVGNAYIGIQNVLNTSGYNHTYQFGDTISAPFHGVNNSIEISQTNSGANTYYHSIFYKGYIRTTGAGNFQPQVSFANITTVSAVSAQANSYIKVTPIGATGLVSNGTWV